MASLRKVPSKDKKIDENGKKVSNWITSLYRGECITITEVEGGFAKVRASDESEGWLQKDQLLAAADVGVATALEELKVFKRPDLMNMSKKGKRELSWIFLIVFGLTASYFLILGEGGYLSLRGQQRKVDQLDLENDQLRQQMQEYRLKIDRLKNDPAAMERLIREHDYALPNEVIVRLPQE